MQNLIFHTDYINKFKALLSKQNQQSNSNNQTENKTQARIGQRLLFIFLDEILFIQLKLTNLKHTVVIHKYLQQQFKKSSISMFDLNRVIYYFYKQKNYSQFDKIKQHLLQKIHQIHANISQKQLEFDQESTFKLSQTQNSSSFSLSNKSEQSYFHSLMNEISFTTYKSLQSSMADLNINNNMEEIQQYLKTVDNFKAQLNMFCQKSKLSNPQFTRLQIGSTFKTQCMVSIPLQQQQFFARKQYNCQGKGSNTKNSETEAAGKVLKKIYFQNFKVWKKFQTNKIQKGLKT